MIRLVVACQYGSLMGDWLHYNMHERWIKKPGKITIKTTMFTNNADEGQELWDHIWIDFGHWSSITWVLSHDGKIALWGPIPSLITWSLPASRWLWLPKNLRQSTNHISILGENTTTNNLDFSMRSAILGSPFELGTTPVASKKGQVDCRWIPPRIPTAGSTGNSIRVNQKL